MDLRKLLKDIRLDNNMSYQDLAEKMDFQRSYISDVEKGKKVSKNFIEKFIKVFPIHKDEILKAYAAEVLPESINDNVSLADMYSVRVYDFISNGDGKINFEKYEIIEFPFDKEDKELILENSFVFKVLSNNMEPYFIESDIIYFSKKYFENWEALDRRLVLVAKNKEYYIRKVHFIKGKPYLVSFNENVYPEIEIDNKVKFIGILGGLLKRYNNEIKF